MSNRRLFQPDNVSPLWAAYIERLPEQLDWIVGGTMGAFLLALGAHILSAHTSIVRGVRVAHDLRGAVIVAAAAAGVYEAISRAACFDDAYISFQYALNLARGDGLVFQPGERVEGYTNFLWTVLLALVHRVTAVELPLLGVVGALASFVLSVGAVEWVARQLTATASRGRVAPRVPLAAVLFALQIVTASHATTGLETAFASLVVTVGLGF